MASFNVTGIEAVIKDLQRMGQQAGDVADRMLMAGADAVRWSWQEAIHSAGHIDTGDMLISVKPDAHIKVSGDQRSIKVYPRGTGSNGTRNAEKAFIAHYGRKRQHGSGFVDLAERNAQGSAWSAMESIWDQFINQ